MTRSSQNLRSAACAGLTAAALAVTASPGAMAATHDIEIQRLIAAWENPEGTAPPGANPPAIDEPCEKGPVNIHWSTLVPNLSDIHTGFSITPAPGLALNAGETGVLANLLILNGTISSFGYLLERVELALQIEGHANGPVNQPLHMPLRFLLTYEDTPNDPRLCPDWHTGDRPCDDRATITLLDDGHMTLAGDATSYTFEVLGFAQDGEIRSSFILPEESTTELQLMARLSRSDQPVPAIPLPPGLALLASGLGLLAWLRPRRGQALS